MAHRARRAACLRPAACALNSLSRAPVDEQPLSRQLHMRTWAGRQLKALPVPQARSCRRRPAEEVAAPRQLCSRAPRASLSRSAQPLAALRRAQYNHVEEEDQALHSCPVQYDTRNSCTASVRPPWLVRPGGARTQDRAVQQATACLGLQAGCCWGAPPNASEMTRRHSIRNGSPST